MQTYVSYKSHILVLFQGSIYGCGTNRYGQLAIPEKEIVYNLQHISSLSTKYCTKITCGVSHSCILDTNNSVYTFGSNEYGQLGARKSVLASAEPYFLGIFSDVFANENSTFVCTCEPSTTSSTTTSSTTTSSIVHMCGMVKRDPSNTRHLPPICQYTLAIFHTFVGKIGKIIEDTRYVYVWVIYGFQDLLYQYSYEECGSRRIFLVNTHGVRIKDLCGGIKNGGELCILDVDGCLFGFVKNIWGKRMAKIFPVCNGFLSSLYCVCMCILPMMCGLFPKIYTYSQCVKIRDFVGCIGGGLRVIGDDACLYQLVTQDGQILKMEKVYEYKLVGNAEKMANMLILQNDDSSQSLLLDSVTGGKDQFDKVYTKVGGK